MVTVRWGSSVGLLCTGRKRSCNHWKAINKVGTMKSNASVPIRKAGMGLIASAVSAAKARLRPILMTALTMIFGLFPLRSCNHWKAINKVGTMKSNASVPIVIPPTTPVPSELKKKNLKQEKNN